MLNDSRHRGSTLAWIHLACSIYRTWFGMWENGSRRSQLGSVLLLFIFCSIFAGKQWSRRQTRYSLAQWERFSPSATGWRAAAAGLAYVFLPSGSGLLLPAMILLGDGDRHRHSKPLPEGFWEFARNSLTLAVPH